MGEPQLRGRVGYGHPFTCRVLACMHVAEWIDLLPGAVTPGYCDRHRTCAATIPIAIFGRENEAWCPWPMSLVTFFALTDQGAFDEHGRTQPVDQWRR